MKYLVTGGSGFIGSHIVDKLIENQHNVVIYDVDAPRYKQECQFIRGDIMDIDRLKKSTINIDMIYHIAAEANVNRFYESPLYSNSITSQSTLNVLECARINNVQRVLLSSTEWIYGSVEEKDNEQITEDTKYAQNPDHLYTASKISAELFCKSYKNLYGINYTIMRYGIPYGERARPETVTPIFISKILNNEEITIHGDGSQSRQFIYVKDLANGNFLCSQKAGENQIFNINGAKKITVLEIVKTLEKLMGKEAKVKFIEDRKGNFKGRFISSEKAKKLLGWEAKYQYEEGIKYYLEHLNF